MKTFIVPFSSIGSIDCRYGKPSAGGKPGGQKTNEVIIHSCYGGKVCNLEVDPKTLFRILDETGVVLETNSLKAFEKSVLEALMNSDPYQSEQSVGTPVG